MLDAVETAPPAATRDPAQAERDLQVHGLAILEGALEAAALEEVRETLYRVAEQDRRFGRVEAALRTDEGAQRVWNLPSRDPVFCDLAEHPLALRLVKSAIGWPVLLSNISANITGPGTGEMMLHADQGMNPAPWAGPHGVNIAWCLDDFTAANGATLAVLGSHLANRQPGPGDADAPTVPLTARAGSLIAIDGRVWHKTGANTTSDQTRAGIFGFYTLPIYLPQENWWLSLDPAVRQFGSDTLLRLLGFRGDGPFGRVNGRPIS